MTDYWEYLKVVADTGNGDILQNCFCSSVITVCKYYILALKH